jgi:ubiquinone/menaquinone biosynthesis C-methylase UbiE
MRTLLRLFFRLLYHPLAFTYDLVSWTVSFGRWNDWIREVVPFIEGTRILEIGHGPGHLQRILLSRGLIAVGLDESPQMGHLAKRRIESISAEHPKVSQPDLPTPPAESLPQSAYAQINLTRGLAQQLPFPAETFDTVVATFPAEYIFAPATLTEAHRVLTETGRFVILPGAVITGSGIYDRFMAWVFRFTGQTPPDLSEALHERSKEPFIQAGFQLEVHELDVKSSIVFIMVATKSTGHG